MEANSQSREIACQWMAKIGINEKIINDYREMAGPYAKETVGRMLQVENALKASRSKANDALLVVKEQYALKAAARECAGLAVLEVKHKNRPFFDSSGSTWHDNDIIWNCAYAYYIKPLDGLEIIFDWLDEQEKA